MAKVGIFIDINEIYRNILLAFKNRKLDYKKFLDAHRDFGEITVARAYGHCTGNENNKFKSYLEAKGYQTSFLQGPLTAQNITLQNIEMMFDIYEYAPELDLIIIAHPTAKIVPLIVRLARMRKKVIVHACKIDPALGHWVDCLEIPESCIMEAKQ